MPNALLSLILIVAVAGLIILLERRYPYVPQQKFLREGFWNDLILYALLQSYLLGLLISIIIAWIDTGTGISRLRIVADWPLWTQVLFFLVTHDLYIYWFHRLQHRSIRLWRLHEAHHSTKDVDWLSGSRSHTLEILINQTVEFAPIVLLGAASEVALIKGVISAVWGMWIHSNIDARTGWLTYVFNGPEMHRWHHSDIVKDGSYNFATKLALWDWMFGTAHLPDNKKPKGYGILEIEFPKSYLRQHLFAFRPLKPDEYRTPE